MENRFKEDNFIKEALDVYRHFADRNHDLLNERTNIFLVWQSILMAGFALGKDAQNLLIIIPILGFAASVLWLYIAFRSRIISRFYFNEIQQLEEKLPKESRVYTNARNFRYGKIRPFPTLSVGNIVCLFYSSSLDINLGFNIFSQLKSL